MPPVQGPVVPPFCKAALGCQGECEDIDACLCMCYTIRGRQASVTTAYFGELGAGPARRRRVQRAAPSFQGSISASAGRQSGLVLLPTGCGAA